MKVAITGHTSGLGKALTTVFSNHIGFSRETGFDLNFPEIRKEVISTVQDCDVFINNAPIGWNQIALLYEVWHSWQDKNKMIINVGSNSADYIHSFSKPYSVQKKALEQAALQLQHSFKPCKVMLLKPGYIDTPSVSEIDAPKINPNELATFIKELAEQKNSSFWIPTITIYPK